MQQTRRGFLGVLLAGVAAPMAVKVVPSPPAFTSGGLVVGALPAPVAETIILEKAWSDRFFKAGVVQSSTDRVGKSSP